MAIHKTRHEIVRTGYDALQFGKAHQREIHRFGCPDHCLYNPGFYELNCKHADEETINRILSASKGVVYLEAVYRLCVQWIKQNEIYKNCQCGNIDMFVRGPVPICHCSPPVGFTILLNMDQVAALVERGVGDSRAKNYIRSALIWRRLGYREGAGPSSLPFHAPYGYSDDDIVQAVKEEPEKVRAERAKRRAKYAAIHGELAAVQMFDVAV